MKRYHLTKLQALLLGFVQGLTEFFPVSSSAHLKITKWFFNLETGESSLFFDLTCHFGTFLALCFYLRKEIFSILKSFREMSFYFLALIPLVPVYFFLKPVRVFLSQNSYLGPFLMFTSLLLFAAHKKKNLVPALNESVKSGRSDLTQISCTPSLRVCEKCGLKQPQKTLSVLFIGMMQAFALIPGISRSGSTIAGARFCGWSWFEAARFSFLLSIPAIFGALGLETWKWMKEGSLTLPFPKECYFIGFFTSLLVGAFSVRFVFWIYKREKVLPFAWYCLGLGLLTWAIFHGKTTL